MLGNISNDSPYTVFINQVVCRVVSKTFWNFFWENTVLLYESLQQLAADPEPTKYTWQNMPRYGGDWFLNAVVTTPEWLQVQSDRTLVALRKLYDNNFSTFNNSRVTNMYGTYSQSQKGAHEGIDFAYGDDSTKIYAIFDGEVLSGGAYHQLSVYDEAKNVNKTYSFLHMSYKDVTSGSVTNGDYVGKQGQEGNASGSHVHFEVHSGRTTALSPGTDHTLGSISPYQLQIYLGEL